MSKLTWLRHRNLCQAKNVRIFTVYRTYYTVILYNQHSEKKDTGFNDDKNLKLVLVLQNLFEYRFRLN